LPEVLAETYRISAQYNLQLANVFHAGDGNLHPLICFDLRRGDDLERVRQAGREIMETCVRAGGSITGEHGVGLDKSCYLPLIFSDDDMSAMLQVRAAFDPSGLCNPGKIIPTPKGCGEARAVATQTITEPLAVSPLPLGEGQGEGEPGKPKFKRDAYAHLEELGRQLEAGMKTAATMANLAVQFNRCGSMFCGYFTDRPVHNLADAMHSDRERFKKYFQGMLREGVYFAPSQFEAGFISTAHTPADLERTVNAAARVFKSIA
jgi:hypothetical protein